MCVTLHELKLKEDFFLRFWSLLSPYCLTSAAVKGLPLVSSFGRGCGEMVAVDGQVWCGSSQNLS